MADGADAAAAAAPADGKVSFFTSLKPGFGAIPADGKTPIVPFLDACAAIVPFFDALGSTAFKPVKMDINGNITKLRKASDGKSADLTLQDLIKAEVDDKKTKAKNSSTDSLLWLKRALSFMREFLANVADGDRATKGSVKKAATDAYGKTLKKHHGMLVKGVFSVAMSAVPSWDGLYKALKRESDDTEEQIVAQIKDFVAAFSAHLDVITAFYGEHKLDPKP
mmetsp:Transcript_26310/g.69142  ORF Transcript_26310/g.69142 Transcript_26310/m.69142 type:complete len:223 (-) Transcript_26310:214-882(-)